jgi:hypothetical protein
VVRAAEVDPDRFGHIVRDMDRTGSIGSAYQRLRALQRPAAPPATARTSAAVRARHERIRELAASGHTPEQIARAVGLVPTSVGAILRRDGIAPAWGLSLKGQLDHTASVERLVAQAAPPNLVLAAIDWAAVDRARVPDWDARLKAAIDVLRGVRKKLRGERP